MAFIDFKKDPHRRLNILTGEWLLVSPQRTERPWQGKVENAPSANRPHYDPKCYLCPGNVRADGSVNPRYASCFSFTNDFSALLESTPINDFNNNNLLFATSRSHSSAIKRRKYSGCD
jgi:UDPglucose--hexose-1-phosphate uridylyltransferase